jgi:transitional endoplasmic reticulum ATPase
MKTLLAKAVANESEANFIAIKGPELLSKWVNETPKLVKKIFEKARQVSPSIIFIDEIDAVAMNRTGSDSQDSSGMNAVNTLLTEMDGMQELQDVVVIAATNRPDVIDTALLRPGRFDRIILVGIPDKTAREQVFKVHSAGMPLAKDVDMKTLVDKTEGYVGADIEAVCREAAIGEPESRER